MSDRNPFLSGLNNQLMGALYTSPINNAVTKAAMISPKVDEWRNVLGMRMAEAIEQPANFLAQSMRDMYAAPINRSVPKGVVLSATEEGKFNNWIQGLPWYKEFVNEYGEAPNLNNSNYDYRAAYKAGITPTKDPYDNNRYHWPSSTDSGQELKAKNHPTAWMEDYMKMTGVDPHAPNQPTLTPQQIQMLQSVLMERYGQK